MQIKKLQKTTQKASKFMEHAKTVQMRWHNSGDIACRVSWWATHALCEGILIAYVLCHG